jgi:hypothetical protein
VFLNFKKTFNAGFLEDFKVFYMGTTVVLTQEIELFTCLENIAFPAAVDVLFLTALADFTEWITAVISAALFTVELDHGPEDIIGVGMVLIGREETHLGRRGGGEVEARLAKFFTEVAGHIGDGTEVGGAFAAVQTARSD